MEPPSEFRSGHAYPGVSRQNCLVAECVNGFRIVNSELLDRIVEERARLQAEEEAAEQARDAQLAPVLHEQTMLERGRTRDPDRERPTPQKETRALLDGMDVLTLTSLRDRALLGVLVYSSARVSTAVSLRVADDYTQGPRSFFRLHEKGGRYN